MSPPATSTKPRAARARRAGSASTEARRLRPSRAVLWRRRLGTLVALLLAGGIGIVAVSGLRPLDDAVLELTLPLKHEDVIRQQAREKNLDAALIAAVIYQESKFRPRTSPAGAKGLMQILPRTATFIAKKSGGTQFELRDLATPQINIAYGSWYLRYLIEAYRGNDTLAVAAYNAGERNVSRWVARAGDPGEFDASRDIPFPETRGYVLGVEQRRKEYREHYAKELGL